MMEKGQTSIEYLLISVFLIAVLVVVFAVSFDIFMGQRVSVQVAEARTTVNGLADMTNFLCTAPRNTTTRRSLTVPPLTDLDQSSIGNETIQLVLESEGRRSVVTATTDCNVTGTVPPSPGIFTFRGVSQGGEGGSVGLNYTPVIDSLRPEAG